MNELNSNDRILFRHKGEHETSSSNTKSSSWVEILHDSWKSGSEKMMMRSSGNNNNDNDRRRSSSRSSSNNSSSINNILDDLGDFSSSSRSRQRKRRSSQQKIESVQKVSTKDISPKLLVVAEQQQQELELEEKLKQQLQQRQKQRENNNSNTNTANNTAKHNHNNINETEESAAVPFHQSQELVLGNPSDPNSFLFSTIMQDAQKKKEAEEQVVNNDPHAFIVASLEEKTDDIEKRGSTKSHSGVDVNHDDEESGSLQFKTEERTITMDLKQRMRSKRFWILAIVICCFIVFFVVGLVVGLLHASPPSGETDNNDDVANTPSTDDSNNNNYDDDGGLILSPPSSTVTEAPVSPTSPTSPIYIPPPPPPSLPPTTLAPTPVPIDYCPQHFHLEGSSSSFVFDNGFPISVSSNTFAYGTEIDSHLLSTCDNNNIYDLSNNSSISIHNNNYGGQGIWYVLDGPGGVVIASTCSFFSPANFDTKLSIFTSTSSSTTCQDGLTCVAMDDNSCSEFSNSSRTSWFAEQGRQYYILVHGARWNEFGDFPLSLELAPIGTCDAAISIPIVMQQQQRQQFYKQEPVIGTLLGATLSIDPCSAGVVGRGGEIWYQVTVPYNYGGHWVIASTCHDVNEFPPRLALYKGSCGNLECATPMHYQQDNDCGLGNSLTWYATPNEVYYILVYKTNYLPGVTFGLTVEELEPPINDNCTNAIELQPDGTIVYGSTYQATYIRRQAELLACSNTNNNNGNGGSDIVTTYSHPGVWYSVRGTGQTLTASTCDDTSNFDTRLSVYSSSSSPWSDSSSSCNELYCIADNDQWCGYQSSVDWNSTLGTIYYILVHGSQEGGVAPSIGNFGLAVYEFTPTINNDCQNAIGPLPVDSSVVTYGSTHTASVDRMRSICSDGIGNEAPGVWYTVIGTGAGIRASTCGSETDFDTRITIYESTTTGFSSSCNDDFSLQCLITDDNGCGFQSQVYWPSIEGQLYYILVHGNFLSSFGHFALQISPYYPNTIHDFCVHAVYANIGVLNVGSTRNATYDGAETCVVPDTAPGVWYRTMGTGNRMIASTCHIVTDYDTRISVFTGSCRNLACIAGNDDGIDDENSDNDDCGSSGSSRVSWLSNPGESYFILVHGWGARTGVFGLTVEETLPSVPNDFCVGATPLWDNNNDGDSIGAGTIALQRHGMLSTNVTFDNVPVCGDIQFNGRGVWYRGSSHSSSTRASNRFAVSTCNSDTTFDTQISVFRGTCGNLECVGGNNDDTRCQESSKRSSVNFFLPSYDETFYILVHGAPPDDIGQFNLVLQEMSQQVVVNDFCTGAIRIPVIVTPEEIDNNNNNNAAESSLSSSATITTTTASNFVVTGSTIDASYDNIGTCVVPNTSPGAWYFVIGTGHILTATTCHEETDFDTRIGIFKIGDGSSSNTNVNANDDNNGINGVNVFTRQEGGSVVDGGKGGCVGNLECVTGNDDTSIAKTVTDVESSESEFVVFAQQQQQQDFSFSSSGGNGCGAQSTASWLSTAEEAYYILVHGFGAHVGNFALSVEERGVFDR